MGTTNFTARTNLLLYAICILSSIILILFAVNIFPIPGVDSIVFIPPALLYSKGFGLANPLYYITKITDHTHTCRFNYYPPFFPLILGILSKIKPGIKTIFLICSFFSIANLFLYTRKIISLSTGKFSLFFTITLVLSIFFLASYLLPTVGRPECLSSLLVFILYIIYTKKGNFNFVIYNFLICILFSLILCTQLLCFYFSFLIFITYEILNSKEIYKTISVNFIRLVFILTICCLILLLSPNGIVNTITGIMSHIRYVSNRQDRSVPLFFFYWLYYPLYFGFLIIFLLTAIIYSEELYFRLKHLSIVHISTAIIVQILVIYGLVKYVLYASPTVYNATQFIMPMCIYLVLNIISFKSGLFKSLKYLLSFFTFFGGALYLFRWVILFMYSYNSGKDYYHANHIVNDVISTNKNVYVYRGIWSLVDNINDVKIFDPTTMSSGDVIIIEQANNPIPQELINKCTIIYDWRSPKNYKFSGIPITNNVQTYGLLICKVN